MNSYNPASLRNTIAATLCTALFSATCLIGTLAPAQAAAPVAVSVQAAWCETNPTPAKRGEGGTGSREDAGEIIPPRLFTTV